MAFETIYLVTGANRGIGLGITASLLLRPHTAVLATVQREGTNQDELTRLAAHPTSTLSIFVFSADIDAAVPLHRAITTKGFPRIDVVIANAGSCSADSFRSVRTTPLETLRSDFEVNALGPLRLFRLTHLLLKGSREGKFVLVSSSLGSIGEMEGAVPSAAYGVSKAGANYLARKIHFEEEGLVVFAVHPGWVKTANGQTFADSIGVAEPPLTLEESVDGVLKLIDTATRESASGKFMSYDGTVLQW